MGAVYRLCRRCGERWNVSCIYPGEKIYICPICAYKARRAGRADATTLLREESVGEMGLRVNGVRIQTEGHRPWLNAPTTPEAPELRSLYLHHKDRPEVVAACLNCQSETCKTGHCAKLQRMGVGKTSRGTREMVKIPMPKGFKRAFKGKTLQALAKRYGVSVNTVIRWRDEAGLTSVQGPKKGVK